MLSKDDLKQIGKVVDERIEPIKKDLQDVKQAVNHTNTAVEALAAGQQDIREKMATKQDVEAAVGEARAELKTDILTIDKKLVRKVQSHERRMDAAGIVMTP